MAKTEALKAIKSMKENAKQADIKFPYEMIYTAHDLISFVKTIEKALKSNISCEFSKKEGLEITKFIEKEIKIIKKLKKNKGL